MSANSKPLGLAHRGMTLIEVLFAIVILSGAVLSVVLLLPLVMRTLEQSRFQMLASLKATEIANQFAQSTRSWTTDGENNNSMHWAQKHRTDIKNTRGFKAGDMPDLEHFLIREHTLAHPVPADIAGRLDSPDNLIAKVIAAGGVLFYPSPTPGITSWSASTAGTTSGINLGPPELQKLVFAVVTPAQQNILPHHPMAPWPYYEMYPFPHQGRIQTPQWTFTAERMLWTDPGPPIKAYTTTWTGPVRSSTTGGLDTVGNLDVLYQGRNWRSMAAAFPTSLWATSLSKLDEMLVWGYSPLLFKLTCGGDTVYTLGGSLADGVDVPVITSPSDARLPPKPALTWPRGSRIQEASAGFPNYFTSVPAAVEAVRTAMNGLYPTPYVFDNELNGRLPSLGMRRFYRELALRLWNELDTGGLGNPMTTDLTASPLSDLHPARILAMSYLAQAAMIVTGYRLPYINTGDDTVTSNDIDLRAAFPGSSDEVLAGVLNPAAVPTAAEIAWAQQVHANLLNWTMRFTSHFPYDLNIPRPANRQMMMDRPLLCWDLFPDGTNALRTPANLYTATESTYPVLQPGQYTAGGGPYAGFANFFAGSTALDREVGDIRLKPLGSNYYIIDTRPTFWMTANTPGATSTWPTEYVSLRGANSTHWWYDQPFDPADRTRELVFWAVDWKNYEDAESAPPLPMDAGNFADQVSSWQWNHPEADLLWANALRRTTATKWTNSNSGVYTTQQMGNISLGGGAMFLNSAAYWGADRNGSGEFEIGPIPKSVRLRATEVARFVFYDPVTYGTLRR